MWLEIVEFIDAIIHDAIYGHMPAYAFMDCVCYDFNAHAYAHFECPCMDVRAIMAELEPGLDVF